MPQKASGPPPVPPIIPAEHPQNITLLLPLHGNLASESQAIYNGFLAAYYYDKQQTQHEINIKVTDVSSGNLQELYAQTVAERPSIIVGPLTKSAVAELANNNITIPTIALNTLDNYQSKITPNFYQFGLAPQDEAQQAAAKILADQHHDALVIMPNNSWGQSIATEFARHYESNGGKVVAKISYTAQDNFDQVVKNALDIVRNKITDPTHKTTKVKWNISYRTDIDAIFLIAQPTAARQIMPLLKYYANALPVYAISAIYNGNPDPILDQDLNGIIFCEMPWISKDPALLTPTLQSIRSQIMTLWPDFANYIKFYALGIDAYFIATTLKQLLTSSQFTIDGATGRLHLDQYNHIYRALEWVQVQRGAP